MGRWPHARRRSPRRSGRQGRRGAGGRAGAATAAPAEREGRPLPPRDHPRGETRSVGDLLVTSPRQTAVDLACWAGSTAEAAVVLELMLGAGLGVNRLRGVEVGARRGAVAARQAQTLIRAGSRSPGETRLRLLYLEEVGDVPLHLNATLVDPDGRFVAIPDLFDEEAGLALEYDGASWDAEREHGHRDVRQHREDNAREEDMERLGVIVLRAAAADLGPFRRQLAYRIQRARAEGLSRDRRRDRWVVRPNPDER